MSKLFKFPLTWIVGVAAVVLFFCSSLRHNLLQSGAFDLGVYDHAVYLISQGEKPIVNFLGFHILGDHAVFVLYGVALLYKIYPSVYWLLAAQAVFLALGAVPTWYLAIQAGLNKAQAYSMAVVYLLYPLIFNINLFDFHPLVLAVPAILGAVLAAKSNQLWWFIGAIIFILSCKAVLAFTVAAMGLWLLIWQQKRLYGAIAIFSGTVWFIVASQIIIPSFSKREEIAAVGRYGFLGDSMWEIALNLALKPGVVIGKIFTLPNLEYLVLLLIPLIWGLSWRHLHPLIGAMPILGLNLLTDYQLQKDLIHQYSLPILPFLLLAVIENLGAGGGWMRSRHNIILWSLVTFLALGKFGYFWSKYVAELDTRSATFEAIARINTQEAVLVPAKVAPHLTHRKQIMAINADSDSLNLQQFCYVMLNSRHLGQDVSSELVSNLLSSLRRSPKFKLDYQQDDVFLFTNPSCGLTLTKKTEKK